MGEAGWLDGASERMTRGASKSLWTVIASGVGDIRYFDVEEPMSMIERRRESLEEARLTHKATSKRFHPVSKPSADGKGYWRISIRRENLDGNVREVGLINGTNSASLIGWHPKRVEANR